MNFSLEVWKRSFQGLGSLADSKHTAAAAADEIEHEDEAGSGEFQTLQEAYSTLEKKVRVLETRLTYKEAQLLNFQEKVTSLQSKTEALEREAGEKDKSLEALKNEVRSLEQQKVEWTRKEENFIGEVQELVSMLEDRCVSLGSEKERSRGLETTLHEKADELRGCRDALQQREEALKCKEAELKLAEDECGDLRENNRLLEENVLKRVLASETKHEELETNVAAAESSLRASRELASELQKDLEQANLKVQELEHMLGKLVEFSREKDDKLDASEWAVQQLGVNEIARAKANLAQAERDHLELQQEFSDLERELKLRDEELADVSSYLTRQLRKLESECSALREKLEAQAVKHERLSSDHEAALSRLEEYEKQLHSEQETNFKLSNRVVVFQRDVAAANEKLREANVELERSQLDNKGLLEHMLLLHQNLLDQNPGHDLEQSEEVELKCGKRCLNQIHEAGKNSLVLPPKRQRQCEESLYN